MEAPFKAGNQDQIQTSYEKILRSIQKLALQTKEQHIRDACQEVLAKVEHTFNSNELSAQEVRRPSPLRTDLIGEGSSQAQPDLLDAKTLQEYVDKLIDKARLKLSDPREKHAQVGITITRGQYNQISSHIRALRCNNPLEKEIYDKAICMSYHSIIEMKMKKADYGKRPEIKDKVRKYRQTDIIKAAKARYYQSDKGKAARARYRNTDKGKAARAKAKQAEKDRRHEEKQKAAAEAQKGNLERR
jgi:hypothetical protein